MRKILLVISLAAIIALNFPKTHYIIGEESRQCDCIGYSYELNPRHRICFGLATECRPIADPDSILFADDTGNFCGKMTCRSTLDFFGIQSGSPIVEDIKETGSKGINLLLVIDTSFSMEGSKINQTKKAAEKLIEDLTPNDFCAIISFNNKAELIHGFSRNKSSLISSLSKIKVGEDTRYLPALDLAQEQYDQLRDNRRKDTIIFLSDGDPLDEKGRIINTSERIKRRGIDIYTVRFGISEKESDDILSRMASETEDRHKGYFVSRKGEEIYDSFKAIYDRVAIKSNFFDVQPIIDRKRYSEGETVVFDYIIKAAGTQNLVPGYTKEKERIRCVSDAEAQVILEGKKGTIVKDLEYGKGSYFTEVDDIKAGTYRVFLNITYVPADDTSCIFHDYQDIGEINITKDGREECKAPSCEELERIARDMDLLNDNYMIDVSNRRRLIIALDTSESMRYDKVEGIKAALEGLSGLYTKIFDVGLIEFNDDARLIQSFTSDREMLKRKIAGLRVRGSTRYMPLISKVGGVFGNIRKGKDYLIIISDGLMWDEAKADEIRKDAALLAKQGLCIYAVGFGERSLEQSQQQEILKSIAESSRRKNGCGGFEQSFSYEMKDTLRSVYERMKGTNGGLEIYASYSKKVLQLNQPLFASARVFSEYNGLEFPSGMFNYTGEEICLPEADVGIRLAKGKEEIYSGDLKSSSKEGYATVINAADRGIYNVSITARVLSQGKECALKGEKDFEVQFGGKDTKDFSFPATLLMLDFLLFLWIMFLLWI